MPQHIHLTEEQLTFMVRERREKPNSILTWATEAVFCPWCSMQLQRRMQGSLVRTFEQRSYWMMGSEVVHLLENGCTHLRVDICNHLALLVHRVGDLILMAQHGETFNRYWLLAIPMDELVVKIAQPLPRQAGQILFGNLGIFLSPQQEVRAMEEVTVFLKWDGTIPW